MTLALGSGGRRQFVVLGFVVLRIGFLCGELVVVLLGLVCEMFIDVLQIVHLEGQKSLDNRTVLEARADDVSCGTHGSVRLRKLRESDQLGQKG